MTSLDSPAPSPIRGTQDTGLSFHKDSQHGQGLRYIYDNGLMPFSRSGHLLHRALPANPHSQGLCRTSDNGLILFSGGGHPIHRVSQ